MAKVLAITKGSSGGGSGTVTSVSVTTANGVSGTVATATTTPAITLVLGAIVPTSVNSVVLSGSATPTLAVTGTSSISGSNTGDQTITLTGAVTGSGTGSFATTIATPGTLTVSTTNSTATAHTHAITSSSAPGAAASILATDASGIIGSTGTRIVKGWFTDLTVTNAIAGSITGNAATVTTNANLTGPVTSSGNATSIASNVALPGSPTTTTQSAGDNSTKIATDAFVTTAIANAIAGVNPAVAVQWATTTAGNTSGLTYSNGVSGVGATLTGANNTAVTIDGHTFVVGDVGVTRLLVKNDTQSPSGAFNGVYLFTALQTVGTGAIFTRALDYDTSSDINNTGAIPVVNGTVNANTSWLLTSSVTNVGTDPLTYTQFSLNPTTIMTTSTYDPAAIAQQVVGTTATQTVTNKRITKRVSALSNGSATPAINTDTTDVVHITAQSAAITSFTTNLTGTPVDGDTLRISVTDNGTARALTFGTSFEASTVALPTTTVISTRLDIGFFWNTETSKWRCVAVA